jgi:hypothetical protein
MDFLRTQRADSESMMYHVGGRRCSKANYDDAWNDAIGRGGRPNSFVTLQGRTASGAAVWRHHAHVG